MCCQRLVGRRGDKSDSAGHLKLSVTLRRPLSRGYMSCLICRRDKQSPSSFVSHVALVGRARMGGERLPLPCGSVLGEVQVWFITQHLRVPGHGLGQHSQTLRPLTSTISKLRKENKPDYPEGFFTFMVQQEGQTTIKFMKLPLEILPKYLL